MTTAWLLCQLFFCTDDGICEPMRETLKEMPSVEAAEVRRDQLHRSNAHPCRIEPEREARWQCSVEER